MSGIFTRLKDRFVHNNNNNRNNSSNRPPDNPGLSSQGGAQSLILHFAMHQQNPPLSIQSYMM